jgi:hypothetical protein
MNMGLYDKKWGKVKIREDRECDHPPSALLPFRFLTPFPQRKGFSIINV